MDPLFLCGNTVMPITTDQPVAAVPHHERRSHCSWKETAAARPMMSTRLLEMLTVLNRVLDDNASREGSAPSETVFS